MSINIKDPEVDRLVRELSQATGLSMTRVVRESLEARYELLEQRKRRASIEELEGIVRRFADAAKGEVPDHAGLLYDERGLPK